MRAARVIEVRTPDCAESQVYHFLNGEFGEGRVREFPMLQGFLAAVVWSRDQSDEFRREPPSQIT
jgi:hypothetical protein